MSSTCLGRDRLWGSQSRYGRPMTDRKDLKRLIRARMAKTGESYSTARRYFLTRGKKGMQTKTDPSLEKRLTGTWESPDSDVVFKFNSLPPGAGCCSLTVDLPTEGAYGLQGDLRTGSNNEVEVDVGSAGAVFEGSYEYGRLIGRWRRRGAESRVTWSRRSTSTAFAMASDVFGAFRGTWSGTLEHDDGTNLRVNIYVSGGPQNVDVIAESLDRNTAWIPAYALAQDGAEIQISFLMAAAPNGRLHARLDVTSR